MVTRGSSPGRQPPVRRFGLRLEQANVTPGGPSTMHPLLSPKNLLIAGLGAAVVGLAPS